MFKLCLEPNGTCRRARCGVGKKTFTLIPAVFGHKKAKPGVALNRDRDSRKVDLERNIRLSEAVCETCFFEMYVTHPSY